MSADIYSVSGRQTKERQLESILRMMGDLLGGLMLDVTVTDINLNPTPKDNLWVTKLGKDAECVGTMEPNTAQILIGAIAKTLDTVLTESNPIVEGELLTDGSRFEGVGRPIVESPIFSIRKKASAVFTLETWEARGLLSRTQRRVIEKAVKDRKNILVCGGAGAGKTTLANAIFDAIGQFTPHDRVVLIEDTRELQCPVKDLVAMRTLNVSATDLKRGLVPVTIRDLLRVALRLFPKRIGVGEVRGPEGFDLLMAWTTGHPGGVSTIHADIATDRGALTRLETMMVMAIGHPMQRLISEAVGLIVCLNRGDDGIRRVTQLVSVDGFDGTDYKLTTIQEEE